MRKNVLTAALLPLLFAVQTAAASESLWQAPATAARSESSDHPAAGRLLRLDTAGLQQFLVSDGARGVALALPRPQGGFDEFVLRDSGTLPPELAAKFPQIRSYVGTSADGREARIDVSPQGLKAMVFDTDGVWLVQPQLSGVVGTQRAAARSDEYLSVARHDLAGPDRSFRCDVHDKPDARRLSKEFAAAGPTPLTVTGTVRRNYRIAVAATYEYTRTVSRNGAANVADGLAAVAAAINRVNQVYERDLGIHLTLVANNDRVIYATANDPYVNGDDDIDVNTGRLNTVIGSANYDIGHVFTTGSGLAGGGVVCGAQKGEGTTGAVDPSGDAFYIDYVAHEIGHQFNAMHTFNGTQGACTARNRYADTAYEPGSGTTILSYAGICEGGDLQPHSDPYFHAISLAEIADFAAGDGARCGTPSNSPGAAPAIDPLSNFIIPARTPFVLTGAAVSASNTLTYAWEQFDLGNANGNLNNDPGNGPIIRSLNPGNSPSRMIPRLATVLGGAAQIGEILPTTNRTMHFRLTVRDAVAGYGKSSSADMTVQSVVTSGAFAVTAPNTAVNWAAGSNQTVNWNVAGTTAAPIACARVGLDLSADGGQTFAHHLGVFNNNGSAGITVPNVSTTQARIRASCVGNIFFNISAPNFSISAGGGGGTQTYRNDADVQIPDNNTAGASSTIAVAGRTGNAPSNASVAVNIVHPYIGDLKLDLIAPDGSVYALRSNSGGGAANIVESYTRNLSSEALNGSWKLRAVDNAGRDVGYINSWTITF